MDKIVRAINECFIRGGSLIWFGNGGSMAEASHASAEFVGIGYPSLALSDLATITALSNDYGYTNVFKNWLKAVVNPEDLVIGISSSGKSKNVNNGLKFAKKLGIAYIDFPRKGKGTSEIQENQLKLIHQLYEVFKYGYNS